MPIGHGPNLNPAAAVALRDSTTPAKAFSCQRHVAPWRGTVTVTGRLGLGLACVPPTRTRSMAQVQAQRRSWRRMFRVEGVIVRAHWHVH